VSYEGWSRVIGWATADRRTNEQVSTGIVNSRPKSLESETYPRPPPPLSTIA